MAIEKYEHLKEKTLYLAAKSFLEKGFIHTTLRGLASELGVTTGAIVNIFETKEDLLCELVKYMLDVQFSTTNNFLKDITRDKILIYVFETVLQLHIAESNEKIRELYTAAYSLIKATSIIQLNITKKIEEAFKGYLPNYETKDFFKLEIASSGIMRGFITVPCNMWFTMEQKVESFIEITMIVYRVPEEKIKEIIQFVKQFDFRRLADNTVKEMIKILTIS